MPRGTADVLATVVVGDAQDVRPVDRRLGSADESVDGRRGGREAVRGGTADREDRKAVDAEQADDVVAGEVRERQEEVALNEARQVGVVPRCPAR